MSSSDVRTRARVSATVVVTLGIIVAEYLFLTWLFHLDDDAERRAQAQSNAAVALQMWEPGDDTAPVVTQLRTLAASGIPGGDALRELSDTWATSQDPSDLAAVQTDVAAAGEETDREKSRSDTTVSLVLVGVLLFVSVGWFVWFRRLVARHREVQAELTERQTVDAGERRLLALVQNSTDVVLVLEPDSSATFVSPSVATVLGRTADELVGRGWIDQISGQDQPVLRQLLLSRRNEDAVQLRMTHQDGRELVMEGTLNNLSDDPSVLGWVLTLRDVTERQRMQDDLTRQAFHDSLTGLANRQLFFDRLTHALTARAGVAAQPLAVLLLDLDDFKDVNDSLGHSVGDRLLIAAGQRISSTIRPGDTAARLGGDEFAVLLEDTDLQTASQLAHRLLAALSEPLDIEGLAGTLRASIGLAEAMPGHSDGADTMRNADVAMYMAKERGKGSIAVYDSVWHQRSLQSARLRTELETAVEEGQLRIHYQPTVELETQRITGFEALVRWEHPDRGLVPPLDFIPLAEQSGLIVPVGTWVLRTATREFAALQTHEQQPSVAVNVAAKQLVSPDFVEIVQSALDDSGLPPDRLVVEITETALLDDLDRSVAALTRLRAQGVRVAIDDFGTGYSSLSHLAQLPVDVLKVDKSFIDRLRDEGQDDVLVTAILSMSRGMRLTSVAEGVEDLAQAEWLREASCTLGQGYLWSRPVTLDAVRALLVENAETISVSGELRPVTTRR